MSKENGEVKTKNNKTQFQVVVDSTVQAVSENRNAFLPRFCRFRARN